MARLDTGWHEHPKILALSLAGMAVHAWSISYCDATRSDGFIPEGGWPSKKGFDSGVKEVIKAGLWEPCAGGFQLHDFAQYNRTKAEIENEQAQNAERQRRWRNGVTNATEPRPERRDSRARAPGPGPGDVVSVDLLKNGSTDVAGAGVGDGADGAPPRASPPRAESRDDANYDAPVPDNLGIVHADAGVCPLCRQVYQGSYIDHTAEVHRVHHDAAPGNLGGHYRRRRFNDEPPEAPPDDFAAHVEAAHQRIVHIASPQDEVSSA